MKPIAILLILGIPYISSAQTMDLPGAPLLKQSNVKNKNADTLKKFGVTQPSAQRTSGTGTAIAPYRFNATVLSSNFTVPLVRVNFLNKTPSNPSSLVSTSFLNSAGAGLSISRGEIDQTVDTNGSVASTSFYNDWGVQLGFLFAVNANSGTTTTNSSSSNTTTTTQSSSVFAVVAGFSILNFQIGAGYELGSLGAGQKRGFLAISYAIPVSTLIKGGYKILGVPTEILPSAK